MTFFIMLSVDSYVESKWLCNWWILKDLEESGRCLIEVLFLQRLEGLRKSWETLWPYTRPRFKPNICRIQLYSLPGRPACSVLNCWLTTAIETLSTWSRKSTDDCEGIPRICQKFRFVFLTYHRPKSHSFKLQITSIVYWVLCWSSNSSTSSLDLYCLWSPRKFNLRWKKYSNLPAYFTVLINLSTFYRPVTNSMESSTSREVTSCLATLPIFFGTRRFIPCWLVAVPRQMNPVLTIPSYLSKLHPTA
jgi:hypothetical protein